MKRTVKTSKKNVPMMRRKSYRGMGGCGKKK